MSQIWSLFLKRSEEIVELHTLQDGQKFRFAGKKRKYTKVKQTSTQLIVVQSAAGSNLLKAQNLLVEPINLKN